MSEGDTGLDSFGLDLAPDVGDDEPSEEHPHEALRGTLIDVDLSIDAIVDRLDIDPESYQDDADALGHVTKSELAGALWTCIRRSGWSFRVMNDSLQIWVFDQDEGIWTRDGLDSLRFITRQAVGPKHYNQRLLNEIVTEAEADPEIRADPDDFGLEPGYVLLDNGMLDLETAYTALTDDTIDPMDALLDPDPDQLAMIKLPVAYEPDADFDEWTALVEEWAEDGRADALQEYIGYCLHVGSMPIHRALMLVGEGRNGKGTFLGAVRAMLGDDNTTAIDLQTLAKRAFARPPFFGSVANIDDDLSSASLGPSGLGMFKKLIAGDPIWAERKGEDGFMFTPTGKHLYAANTVPDVNVADDDIAFWDRWEVVEFPNYYPPEDRDLGLKDRLSEPEYRSRVLNWAIVGWGRLFDQGGRFTGELETWEKREYWQRYGESIDQFIAECIEQDADAEPIRTGTVYDVYIAWCDQHGEAPESQHKLTGRLKSSGYTYKSSVRIEGTVTRGFVDLVLTADAPPVDALDAEPRGDDVRHTGLASFDNSDTDDDDRGLHETVDTAICDIVEVVIDCTKDDVVDWIVEDDEFDVDRDRVAYRLEQLLRDGTLALDADGHIIRP